MNADDGRECLDETMQAMIGARWQPAGPIEFPPDAVLMDGPHRRLPASPVHRDLPREGSAVTYGEICRETIETGHQDFRYRLSVMPGTGATRKPDGSWVWARSEPVVDLHLLPVYAFTELLFGRVSRFMVAYDPARGVLEQFGELVAKMREESAGRWLGPAVVVLAGETGFHVE